MMVRLGKGICTFPQSKILLLSPILASAFFLESTQLTTLGLQAYHLGECSRTREGMLCNLSNHNNACNIARTGALHICPAGGS